VALRLIASDDEGLRLALLPRCCRLWGATLCLATLCLAHHLPGRPLSW